MHKVTKNISNFDVLDMIEGNDVYNSKFLEVLTHSEPDKSDTTLKKYVGRLDLITRYLYGEEMHYQGIIAIYNKILVDDETKWTNIKSFTPEKISLMITQ